MASEPRPSIRMRFCATCGRDSLIRRLNDRHYNGGQLCEGTLKTLEYLLNDTVQPAVVAQPCCGMDVYRDYIVIGSDGGDLLKCPDCGKVYSKDGRLAPLAAVTQPECYEKTKRGCTGCDAKQRCGNCNDITDWACAECRIAFGVTIYVCPQSQCRDVHEAKCRSLHLSTQEQIDHWSAPSQPSQGWVSSLVNTLDELPQEMKERMAQSEPFQGVEMYVCEIDHVTLRPNSLTCFACIRNVMRVRNISSHTQKSGYGALNHFHLNRRRSCEAN